MKLSEQWLRQAVNPDLSTAELVEQITMAGLEVDAVEPVAPAFSGVLVAEIVAIAPHPDADKLRVCQVDDGSGEPVQVVCGAANAAAGLKVPLATVGAVLPGDFKIKQAKLRGVPSHGMLCAEQELGLAEKSDGLMVLPEDAPVGADIRDYLELNDQCIEIDLTPNRADCLSVRGVAREVGVLNQLPVNQQAIAAVAPTSKQKLSVKVEAVSDCPRYTGRVISGVDVSRPTPLWMRERLRRSGVRSIDIIVDITNYVLLELGQPMHAFDLAKVQGGIVVRHATDGEELRLLDGQSYTLTKDTLVIADQKKALAMAGIMGGEASAVSAETRDIFLESAYFTPVKLAGRARHYGLHTDSSHRFERGVDFQLPAQALERATALVVALSGGEPGPVVEKTSDKSLPSVSAIRLRRQRIEQVLGLAMDDSQVEDILYRLGMGVAADSEGWRVTPPSWRFDIALEVDLLEELARCYGYNRLPVRPIQADLQLKPATESRLDTAALKRQLLARDYQEAISYSFIDPKWQQLLFPEQPAVVLKNPIASDMASMRTSLWPGLLKTLVYNSKRQQERIRLFETGLTFIPQAEGLPQQEAMLAGLISGRRQPENWTEQAEMVDFFDAKGDLESLLALTGNAAAFSFSAGGSALLHPGQSATIRLNGEIVGEIGAIHPEVQEKLDLSRPCYLFQLKLAVLQARNLPEFTELSKFPEVRRDLAILIDREIAAEDVLQRVRQEAGSYLTNLRLFDIYEGKGIDPKRKSLAMGLTFQHPSRTLNEEEISLVIESVVADLSQTFAATLRN